MAASRIHAIVNPASGNGRTRKEWPRLLALMEARLGKLTWEWTEGPGHATRLAIEALEQGCERIWSVGGDGTHHEVANAFLSPGRPMAPDAAMATLSRGTGSDLIKSLGIPKDPKAAIEVLIQDLVSPLDAGWLRYRDPQGEEQQRAFLNITSFGIGGEVDLRVNRSSKALGGFISFLWASLATLLTYRAREVRYALDGGPWQEEKIVLIAVANGQFFGGGMWVAPTARPDDGHFDVIVGREMSLLQLLPLFGRLYKGTHLSHPKVSSYTARTLVAESSEAVWLDVDGEPLGTLPVKFRIIPQALKVLVGPGFHATETNRGGPA